MKVELVGVCDHPSAGKQWWRPDGTPLDTDEFQDYDYDDAVTVKENQYARLLALKFDDTVVQDARITWSLEDSRESRFAPDYVDKARTKRRCVQVILAAFPKTIESTNLRLGVATGPWRTVASGTPGMGAHTKDNITQSDVIYHEASEENGHISISATHLLGWNYDCRIYARGKNGEVFEPYKHSNPGADMRHCKSEFDIPLEKVKMFHLQARSYHWVTFKNISIRKSVKTDVQIELENELTAKLTEKSRRILLSDVDRRNKPNILDLSSGQTFTMPDDLRTDELAISNYFNECRKGDVWFTDGDIIGTLRNGTIQSWDGYKITPLSYVRRHRGSIKSYSLSENSLSIPCRLLVTDWNGLSYDVKILGLTNDGGIELEYRFIEKANVQPEKTQKRFSAYLSNNGVTVELIGVCDHPSVGKRWWRPDGSALAESPYDDGYGRAFPKEGEKGYKFAVKFSGMAGKEVDARVIPTNFRTTNGGGLFRTTQKNGQKNEKFIEGTLDEKIVCLGAAFDEQLVSCSIKVGVCFGRWKKEYKYETDQPDDAIQWVVFKDVLLQPDKQRDLKDERAFKEVKRADESTF